MTQVNPDATTSRSYAVANLGLGRLLSALFGLATMMILSRVYSRAEYGTYEKVWLVYEVLNPIFLLGLPTSLAYFIPQLDARGQKKIIVQTTVILAVAGLLISLVMYAGAGMIRDEFDARDLAVLIRLFVLFPICAMPVEIVNTLLVSTNRARVAALFQFMSSGLQFVAVVLPVMLGAGFRTVILTLDVMAVVRLLAAGSYIGGLYRGEPTEFDLTLLKRQLKYALPIGLSGVVGILASHLDRLIVAARFGAQEYALYTNGAIDLRLDTILTTSVMGVLTPAFVLLFRRGQHEEIARMWHSATTKVALIIFPITSFMLVFSSDFIITVFSEKYERSVPFFRIFLLLLPLKITVYSSLLVASGRSVLVFKATCGALIANIVLNLLLIPPFGILGSAVATVVAAYLLAGWQLGWCKQLLDVSWREVLPWRSLGRLAAISALAGLAAWLCTRTLPCGVFRGGIGLAVFLVAITPMMLKSGEIRAELDRILKAGFQLGKVQSDASRPRGTQPCKP